MTSFLISPKFYNLKHCFIELSKQLQLYSYKHIAFVEWSNGKAYLWVTFRLIPLDICRLDINFSTQLGLVQEPNLCVSFPNVYFPDCIRLFLVPKKIEDWEILDPETHKLADLLLDQQRILSKDLAIPFWIHSNVCVNLYVLDVNPFSDYVILQPNSELYLFSNSTQYEKFMLPHDSTTSVRPIGLLDDFIPSQLFGGLVNFVSYTINGLSSSLFTNEKILTSSYIDSHQDEVRKNSFLNRLFNPQNNSGCLLKFSQFRTDGYSLFLKNISVVLPQNLCQTSLFNSQFPVLIDAFRISTSSDYIHPNCNNRNFFPTRLYSISEKLSGESNLILLLGEHFSECSCFLIYPSSLQHSKISKVSLHIAQNIFSRIGEFPVILTFKELVCALSIDSPFPVLCNQLFLMKRDDLSFWLTLKFECVNDLHLHSYSILNASILEDLPITVTTSHEISDLISNKSCQYGISPPEIHFFAFDKLKDNANTLLHSFFSSFNQFSDYLSVLVSSDSNTPQVGRKTFAKYLLESIRTIDSTFIVNSVDGLLLKGKTFSAIKKSLFPLFNQERSSVAIVYNFEHLVPEDTKSKVESDTSYSIGQYIFSEINKKRSWKMKFIFIATSRCSDHLHKSMVCHQGRHIFQHALVIKCPSDQDRSEILDSYLKMFTNVSNKIDTNLLVTMFPNITPSIYLPLIQRSIQNSILDGNDLTTHGHLFQEFSDYIILKLGKPDSKSTGRTMGINNVKNQICEILKLQLSFPRLISSLPLKIKIGILLYGMPGTGKTFLVESLIDENKINVIKIRGPEILEKYVGASEERIREIFASARNTLPCLIFFDEFDSIARSRGSERTGVLDRVVNQLLTELDGIREIEGISVIATTCHPELIDRALLRAGRLGMHIECKLPNDTERLEIMESLISNIGFDFCLGEISEGFIERTIGYTRADLKAVITNLNESGLRNCFDNYKFITKENFMEALSITAPSLSIFDIQNFELNYTFFRKGDFLNKQNASKVTCA